MNKQMIKIESALNADLKSESPSMTKVFAKWIADNADNLTSFDISILMSVRRALHLAEAEERWRESC